MIKHTKIDDFYYHLPNELIAKDVSSKRDECKLLVMNNTNQNISDLQFTNIIDFLKPNDLLILNDSKVLKARLFGHKSTGGKIEILIERVLTHEIILCHIRANKTIPIGMHALLPNNVEIEVIDKCDGLFKIHIYGVVNIFEYLEKFGVMPLPPYINRDATDTDNDQYQTVYANELGSVAAPTAGLHFTHELLEKVKSNGTNIAYVTLHIGSGTFKPVSVDNIHEHKMHSELYHVSDEVLALIKATKKNNGRVIAVGTTSVRVLEDMANNNYQTGHFETDIFITPGFKFKVVDVLITNFHLPKSTLLMLVSAFAGYDEIKKIYQHAIDKKYRFYSYGDAMLLYLKGV